MLRKKLIIQHLIIIATASIGFSSVHAGFYRWVDDDGTIHYSDRLPPSVSQRQQEILNQQGRTIETIPAPKTIGELEEEATQLKIEEERRMVQEEHERRDRILLAMYLTVDDIEQVRDERIATVEAAIEITKIRKEKFIKKLHDLDASEQRFKANGSETPSWLIKSRAHYQEQLSNVNEILAIKEEEKLSIKKRFSGDINRYLELKRPDLAVQ